MALHRLLILIKECDKLGMTWPLQTGIIEISSSQVADEFWRWPEAVPTWIVGLVGLIFRQCDTLERYIPLVPVSLMAVYIVDVVGLLIHIKLKAELWFNNVSKLYSSFAVNPHQVITSSYTFSAWILGPLACLLWPSQCDPILDSLQKTLMWPCKTPYPCVE